MSQSNDGNSDVYLGYIEEGDSIDDELALQNDGGQSSSGFSGNQSIPPWLLNKIGGMPIFPYIKEDAFLNQLDTALDAIKCKHCKSDCVFVLQLKSSIDSSHLDRVIQIYTCVKPDCIKHSWFALRCMIDPEKELGIKSLEIPLKHMELIPDTPHGGILACKQKAFFKPFHLSVMEEPTGRENFAKNNLEALKLASKFSDPDLKPAPIEAKYKNLKNYKPPQPPAHLSDLEDFERFQMEKLYGNDKEMYRFYKRVARFPSQIIRYEWEGRPLLNSNKTKIELRACSSCSSKRNFELQVMSGLINYLSPLGDFDRETLDFSSIIVHSCSNNCCKESFVLEDTHFMPDPDSRVFNKVKQKILATKLRVSAVENEAEMFVEEDISTDSKNCNPSTSNASTSKISKKKKRNKK